jgi:diadenosine tetraphosphatase ApaH/serine/threonine PP2A family protein phosphatase
MSKIALLSDIHANLPAFEAVLSDVRASGAEQIVFLGDLVGYGASPAECVALVRNLGGPCVMGNHDVEIRNVRKRACTFRDPAWPQSGYLAGLAHAARCLDAAQAEWLAALPYHLKIPGALIAHASLDVPEAFASIEDATSAGPTLAILRQVKLKVGFFGHTHLTGLFADDNEALVWLDPTRVKIPEGMACAVTVGSVGQPLHPSDRRATWALWDSEAGVVEFRKTLYNRLQAAREIVAAGLPLECALRLLANEEAAFLLG